MKLSVELEQDYDSEMFEDLQRYLKYHPRTTRFLFNPAGITFMIGVLLFVGLAAGLAAIFFVDSRTGANIWAVIVTEVFAGREVAIPIGLGLGVPVAIVWGVTAVQDLITTSWLYPLFYLFRKRNLDKENFAGYFFARLEKTAEKHRPFVERWGAIGLFVFMLIPFAVNGPLIGAILGKLAGIRTRYILPTVVMATFTAVSLWTGLYVLARPSIEAFEGRFGGHWIQLLIVGILLVVLLQMAWSFHRDARHYRRIRARREELARRGHVAQTLVATQDAPAVPGSVEDTHR